MFNGYEFHREFSGVGQFALLSQNKKKWFNGYSEICKVRMSMLDMIED